NEPLPGEFFLELIARTTHTHIARINAAPANHRALSRHQIAQECVVSIRLAQIKLTVNRFFSRVPSSSPKGERIFHGEDIDDLGANLLPGEQPGALSREVLVED